MLSLLVKESEGNEMIERNCFGKIEPRIGVYFVQKESDGYHIKKQEPWYVTDAVIYNPYLIWINIEPFPSLVKAYAWLKANVNNLL